MGRRVEDKKKVGKTTVSCIFFVFFLYLGEREVGQEAALSLPATSVLKDGELLPDVIPGSSMWNMF